MRWPWPMRRHEHKWNVLGVQYIAIPEGRAVRNCTSIITWNCVNSPCMAFKQKVLMGWVPAYGYTPPRLTEDGRLVVRQEELHPS